MHEYCGKKFNCGLPSYEYKAPFDASAMVRFHKRLTSEKLAAINEEIIKNAETKKKQQEPDDHDKTNPPSAPPNKVTLIVDATCAPSQIKYSRDVELRNEAHEKLERMRLWTRKPNNGISVSVSKWNGPSAWQNENSV